MEPARFCAQMQAYIEGTDPAFPDEDRRLERMREALVRLRPPPAGLRPLLGPRGAATEVDMRLIKRDSIALCVVDSLIVRLIGAGEPPAPLLERIVEAGVHFSFDPLYAESHTRTGEEVSDFLAQTLPSADTAAALQRFEEPLLERWRARATDKSTSTLFGIVLRHRGAAGAARLLREWPGMREDERVDLIERLGRVEADRPLLEALLEALLDTSAEVRSSALRSLRKQGAPVEGLDASMREEEMRPGLERARRWIQETNS
ncbi:MAG: hypothetical protein ACT4PV_13355 [Planctomycetaceae bacterium]